MSDTKPRAPGCTCHQEEGDSSCPVHGDCANCGEMTPFCCSVAMTDEIRELRAAFEAREAEVEALREAQTRHLELIRDMTQAPLPEDCIEARNRVGVLTAKCATLRNEKEALESRAAELERDLALMTRSRDDFRAVAVDGERFCARAAELEAALRALVEAMPRCQHGGCRLHAVARHIGTGLVCEVHAASISELRLSALPLSPQLRAALLLLAKGGTR